MAKISELTTDQLDSYIEKFQSKVKEDASDENKKKLSALLKEKEKRSPITKIKEDKVEKFYTDDINYSTYEAGGFGARTLAMFIDSIFVTIALNILLSVMTMLVKATTEGAEAITAIMLVVTTILYFFTPISYYIYFMRINGQTLGKKIMGLKVINEDGSDQLSIKTIVMRETLGKFLSSIIFLAGFIVVLFKKDAWHDRIASTRVVTLK